MTTTIEKSRAQTLDSDALNMLLGLYLTEMDVPSAADMEIEDAGCNEFPADSVLVQIIKPELTELAELVPVGGVSHWVWVAELTTKFTIDALTATLNEPPREAITQIAELVDKLKTYLRDVIESARKARDVNTTN